MDANGYSKLEFERLIIDSFISAYNRLHSSDFRITGRSERPDFKILSPTHSTRMGVEVTLAVFDTPVVGRVDKNLEAKKIFGRKEIVVSPGDIATPEARRATLRSKLGGVYSTANIAEVASKTIESKILKSKGYDWRDPIILVIGFFDPCRGVRSIKLYALDDITVPRECPFLEIWINCMGSDDSGIIQLWPTSV